MQILGTGSQRAGKTSRIVVTSIPLAMASWSVNLTKDDYPTVNFESFDATTVEAYDEGLSGPLGADVRFGGDWDAGTNPLDSPPGLYPRDDLLGVTLFTSTYDLVGWDFDYMRLRSSTSGADVKGKVTFDCAGKNQGFFLLPTGSV